MWVSYVKSDGIRVAIDHLLKREKPCLYGGNGSGKANFLVGKFQFPSPSTEIAHLKIEPQEMELILKGSPRELLILENNGAVVELAKDTGKY